ncbi:serine hydrolase [Lutimaribacter saemankumensis]|uniref:serine hydrolase n=1 Tax=Lutimaribacter saemankumensis TaxID=490829 RepID=UPI0015874106|nr:serine hydrolase [Lutimaribacter saemankumensis]
MAKIMLVWRYLLSVWGRQTPARDAGMLIFDRQCRFDMPQCLDPAIAYTSMMSSFNLVGPTRKNDLTDMLRILATFFCLMIASVGQANNQPVETPLHMAALLGDLSAVEKHIEAGTDLDQRDDFGSTPLIIAAVFGKVEVVAALLAAGADPTIRDDQGSNPLHIAAFLGRVGVVEALLDAGADRYARSASGAMAYDYAAAPLTEENVIFDQLRAGLGPLGFWLDDAEAAAAKPAIAQMLRPAAGDLRDIDFTPVKRDDFEVSTPEAEGLDPVLVAELYRDAQALPRLYSVLVIKNGKLVAEKYFNDGAIDSPTLIQSAAKSIFSAFVGLAHREGCLPDLDARVMDFFPDIADQVSDRRKSEITIRQLLQMRSGFPWEETDPKFWQLLLEGDHLAPLRELPLVADPGTAFNYSNFSTDLLGVIVSRACSVDLSEFASEQFLRPLNIQFGDWIRGKDYHYPIIHLTPRTAARIAQLYLERGTFEGKQVLPKDWVASSLADYSDDAWVTTERLDHAGRYLGDLGYGYQWWQASVGGRRINFAWGHGGQFYGLVHDLNMVVIVTAYPAWQEHGSENWTHERAHLNLAGKFISLLP